MYSKKTLTLTDGHSSITGEKIGVVVLYADFRGFSNWLLNQPTENAATNAATLIKIEYERVIQICNDHHPCFHKFLGDGFLLLWEADENLSLDDCFRHALDAAFHTHKTYFYAAKEFSSSFAPPAGMGIGISLGEAIRIQPETFLEEMNEVDFLGYPMNCGARMQSLSGVFETTLCSACVHLISGDAANFLYPKTPGFRRTLISPSENTLQKANGMNGLSHSDRTEFMHLGWPDSPFHKLSS
jgi:class 3 adenylate cyclase